VKASQAGAPGIKARNQKMGRPTATNAEPATKLETVSVERAVAG
jgi:hypothetical protein